SVGRGGQVSLLQSVLVAPLGRRLPVVLDDVGHHRQALLQIIRGHYWEQFYLRLQSKAEAFHDASHPRGILHIEDENPAPLSLFGVEIRRFWLEVSRKLL